MLEKLKMAQPPNRPVFMVHGINSSGEWFKEVKEALSPHFDCIPAGYEGYRGKLGWVRLVTEPALCFAWLILVCIGALYSIWLAVSATLLFLALSFICARRRRARALNTVRETIVDKLRGIHQPPHIVAHSFGTHLVTGMLWAWPDSAANCVIFAAGVVPKEFAWKKLLKKNPRAVLRVRNEFSHDDLTVRFLSLVEGFVVHFNLGSCGYGGFIGPKDLVHTLGSPWEDCKDCSSKHTAKVHNVPSEGIDHHRMFVTARHARTFWLPYLWRLEPGEYRDFMELCEKGKKAMDEDDQQTTALAERICRERRWKWAANCSLRSCVHRELKQYCKLKRLPFPNDAADQVAIGVVMVWKDVIDAANRQATVTDPHVVAAMHPLWAVTRVVRTLMGLQRKQ
ncbi:MAG: hypothetical protein Q8N47_05270 [Bryobacterales bacterium]|nr:hypothetical protein [Bryobacterales bacterium]